MKIFIFISLLFNFSLWAQVEHVNVEDFSFQYTAPNGSGTAQAFSFGTKYQGVQDVTIEKTGQDFLLKLQGVENREFELKNAPQIMVDAERMEVDQFDLNFDQNLSLSLNSAEFISPSQTLSLDKFFLSCFRKQTGVEVLDQIIIGCVEQMKLTADFFSSASSKALSNILNLDEHHLQSGGVELRKVDFNINQGILNFTADMKAQISGKVRGKGNASYDESKNLMTLKINEVKFGILNVTGKIFDELEKLQSDKVKVARPYVYLQL